MSDVVWVLLWTLPLIVVEVLARIRAAEQHSKEVDRICGIADMALRQMETERQTWAIERQQLLDRIQAPTFSEYKHAELKQTKLQLGVKDPPPLEPM